jgi:hypothetical protein
MVYILERREKGTRLRYIEVPEASNQASSFDLETSMFDETITMFPS